MNTTDLGLIKDAANPLDRWAKRGTDMLAEMQRQSGQTEDSETNGQTETTQTSDAVGTPSAPPPVQSVPPRLRGMLVGFIMISQSM